MEGVDGVRPVFKGLYTQNSMNVYECECEREDECTRELEWDCIYESFVTHDVRARRNYKSSNS